MKTVLSSGHNSEYNRDEVQYTDGTRILVGHLVDSDTNDTIRPATASEQIQSDKSDANGQHGHIMVSGRRCYVSGSQTF